METAFQEGLSCGKSVQPVGRAIKGEEWSKGVQGMEAGRGWQGRQS